MISFGVWAPTETVFWQSWISAGICKEPNVFNAPFAGCVEVSTKWPGIVPAKLLGQTVYGWHANVRVFGAVEASFRAGCPTVGTIWETTHAAEAFGLTQQDADPETGFPAGMRSSTGVVYADASAFKSPANVWA